MDVETVPTGALSLRFGLGCQKTVYLRFTDGRCFRLTLHMVAEVQKKRRRFYDAEYIGSRLMQKISGVVT